MRTARNGFRERPKQKPVELEIEIKRATAANIARAQGVVDQAHQQLSIATAQLNAEMRSLLTERGIEEARPIKITDTSPCKLVVQVLKYAKPEAPEKKKK